MEDKEVLSPLQLHFIICSNHIPATLIIFFVRENLHNSNEFLTKHRSVLILLHKSREQKLPIFRNINFAVEFHFVYWLVVENQNEFGLV